ncbi:MAG TPA: DUF4406 domain-containing protein [Alphaproteobacteria bacterium]|nr:DUF4406 domain-containing protein [Alphaproteobacteria bacterium]
MVIYLIGKISDKSPEDEERNRRLAAEVGAKLWRMGHAVIIPHLNDYHHFLGYGKSLTWDDFMRGDKELLAKADAVVVLPNWRDSRGSNEEIRFAKERGIPLYYWPEHPEPRNLYRHNCLLVLISGKQGAGKTTLANHVWRALDDVGTACLRVKYAEVLYELHDLIWGRMANYLGIQPPKKDARLLQLLGTEWGRCAIHENVWVDVTRKKLEAFFVETAPHPAVAIIDDVRFMNELHIGYPHKLCIRLNAPRDVRRARCDAWRDDENHPSEVGLDGAEQCDRMTISYLARRAWHGLLGSLGWNGMAPNTESGMFDMVFDSYMMSEEEIANVVIREIRQRIGGLS